VYAVKHPASVCFCVEFRHRAWEREEGRGLRSTSDALKVIFEVQKLISRVQNLTSEVQNLTSEFIN
jgi:hypothetical protein